jgi:hypothetical protein
MEGRLDWQTDLLDIHKSYLQLIITLSDYFKTQNKVFNIWLLGNTINLEESVASQITSRNPDLTHTSLCHTWYTCLLEQCLSLESTLIHFSLTASQLASFYPC